MKDHKSKKPRAHPTLIEENTDIEVHHHLSRDKDAESTIQAAQRTVTKRYLDIRVTAIKGLRNILNQGLQRMIVEEGHLTTGEDQHTDKLETDINIKIEGEIIAEDHQAATDTVVEDTIEDILHLLRDQWQNLNRSRRKKLHKNHLNRKMLCCLRQLEAFTCHLIK